MTAGRRGEVVHHGPPHRRDAEAQRWQAEALRDRPQGGGEAATAPARPLCDGPRVCDGAVTDAGTAAKPWSRSQRLGASAVGAVPRERIRRGFTLLELLVASMIFVVVAAAGYSLFHAGRNVSSRAEARAELFQTARAALSAIEKDLRAAVQSGSAFDTGLIGADGGSPEEPLDEIEFVAASGRPVGTSEETYGVEETEKRTDLVRRRYWVEEGGGLVRTTETVLTAPVIEEPEEDEIEEVAPDVVFLDLQYFQADWSESWNSQLRGRLPEAVEITVHVRAEWRGEEILEKFSLRVSLPMSMEPPQELPQ